MDRNVRGLPLALLLSAILAGCATAGVPAAATPAAQSSPTLSQSPQPIPVPSAAQVSSGPAVTTNPGAPAPSSSPRPAGSPADGTITLDDNGSTLTLAVGDRVLLRLGSDFDWTVSVENPSVLDRLRNITVVQGAQGVYEARAAGRTTLRASGDPPCRKSTPPCMAPSILFEVTMIVAP